MNSICDLFPINFSNEFAKFSALNQISSLSIFLTNRIKFLQLIFAFSFSINSGRAVAEAYGTNSSSGDPIKTIFLNHPIAS